MLYAACGWARYTKPRCAAARNPDVSWCLAVFLIDRKQVNQAMLNAQAQVLLTKAQLSGVRPRYEMQPNEARIAYLESRLPTQPAPQSVHTRDLQLPGLGGPLSVRAYRPLDAANAQPLPALVFFHGGGWVIGDLETHDVLCRSLCHLAGCAVFAVDYRLAPEHRFPAAFDDALLATQWLAQHAPELGIDALRMAVAGDSAGGNLAAGVSLVLRDAAKLKLVAQVLVYPVTDLRCNTKSYQTLGQGYLLSAADMLYFRGHYLEDLKDCSDWRASPLLAADHRDLAPALILTAGYDPLRDEGQAYAQRLVEAGNTVEHICFEGQMHGFLGMGKAIDEANTAVQCCADWLKRYFFNA
jgi:acetyl esterase